MAGKNREYADKYAEYAKLCYFQHNMAHQYYNS